MASVNKVLLIGNLGRDPETRFRPDGKATCSLSLATSESWKDKTTGEKQERTEWHRVVFFGRAAEVVGEYAKKGGSLYVEGKLSTRKWTDKEGQDRYTTEVIGDRFQFLGGGSRGEPAEEPAKAPASKPATDAAAKEYRDAKNGAAPASTSKPGSFDDMDDDIPFASCLLGDDVIWRKLHWGSE